jgi:hypothetical protein
MPDCIEHRRLRPWCTWPHSLASVHSGGGELQSYTKLPSHRNVRSYISCTNWSRMLQIKWAPAMWLGSNNSVDSKHLAALHKLNIIIKMQKTNGFPRMKHA